MTKEDKQIINRAVKETWRIGDRTRLKHLLEKNLTLYYENAELEKENAELKEWKEQTIKARGRDYMDWSRMKDQLTKATKLLKWALHSDPEHDNLVDFDTKWKEAEQFLREIEK